MNTFERVEEVLINAADVHCKAADLYSSLHERSDNPRVRMLLDDMVSHEQRAEKLIGEFLKKSDRAVLDTYLQYTLEIDSDACIDSLVPSVRTLELSDINRLGQQVHDYIVNLLEGAQRETASADVNELLDEILEVERAERKNFSKMGDSAYDL